MARIGEFGRARAELVEEPDTFTFYGEEFEVPAGISAVVLMDFVAETQAATEAREDALARQERAEARLARGGSEQDRLLARAALDDADRDLIAAGNRLLVGMRGYVRGCLGEDDDAQWRRFNAVCREQAVDSDELMEVCAAIFSAVSARPTRRPSDSSDGPSSIGVGSTAGAGSPAVTGGPLLPATVSPGPLLAEPGTGGTDGPMAQVVELTPLERQRQEALAHTVPVSALLRSGG